MKRDLFFKLLTPLYSIVVFWCLSASQLSCSTHRVPESSRQFGYHALKINNHFVDPAIFCEERNRFFVRWHTNTGMIYKTEEERQDSLLEDIITRVVLDEFLLNQSGITVSPQETDDYINHFIKPKYSSSQEFDAFLHNEGYKDETDLRKGIELHLLKRAYFVKLAKDAGLTIPPRVVDSLYRNHVNENSSVVTRQILISDTDPVKALQLAGDLYHQCEKGTDFSALAKRYSSDETAGSTGGLHPPHSRAGFDSALAEKIFTAHPGEVLAPVKTGPDYLLIKVERFISTYHPETEFTDMLLLERFGKSELFRKWIAEQKSKSSITIVDPSMKAFRFFRSGRYDQAGTLYEKLFRKQHDEFNLKRAIDSFEKAGNLGTVLRLAQTGMRIHPENIAYTLTKAECLYRQGRTRDALALLQDAELRSQGSVYFKEQVAKTYSKLGLVK